MLHNVDSNVTRLFEHLLSIETQHAGIEPCRQYLDPSHADFDNAEFFHQLTDDEADAFRLNFAVNHFVACVRFIEAGNDPLDDEQIDMIHTAVSAVMPYMLKANVEYATDSESTIASPWSYFRVDAATITLLFAAFSLETSEASADPSDDMTKMKVQVLADQAVRLLNFKHADACAVIREHLFAETYLNVVH